MRSLRFMWSGNPATLGDVVWLKKKRGHEIAGGVELAVERQMREHFIEGITVRYECDALMAEFSFRGWESPIRIAKEYENDFSPPREIYIPPSAPHLVENANRRIRADYERIRQAGIPLCEKFFTQAMVTRERPSSPEQRVCSLQDAIDLKTCGEGVSVNVETFVSLGRSGGLPLRVFGAVYTVETRGEKFHVMKEYVLNSNMMYAPNEEEDIANRRMMRDVSRLQAAGIMPEYKKFEVNKK
ncbi:hypothetical protein JW707_01455 [Candidatus Woesearchaeota archaeon]|nr:hypothetical protein [Candidatus Woesearchaeota archaeon]